MMQYFTLLTSVWTKLKDIVVGIFAIIPQVMYFLYASASSLLDGCQLLLRKLAGLDVYYVKDAAGSLSEKSGDILTEFIEGILGINQKYSALNTVFWSLVVFGVMILVLSTIFAIIKAHYNYDSSKSQPMKIIGQSLKSLALMAITPVMVLCGIYLSEIVLRALDTITSPDSTSQISSYYESDALQNFKTGSSGSDGSGKVYYSSLDMFGVAEFTNTSTFSGMLFKFVTYDANRVRSGSYEALATSSNGKWDSCGIFYSTLNDSSARKEKVASQIDFAFMNCLQLQNKVNVAYANKEEAKYVIGSTLMYGPSAGFAVGLFGVNKFSKFNVGLVWYYYDLWAFNFLLGYLGIGVFLLLLSNIMFGLMKRLVICVALFLVHTPVIGISPLDGGNGFSTWKNSFIGYVISAYGAIVGMNLFFAILPVLESISFFNIELIDRLFDLLIVACGFTMIKKFISLISSFIGANDLNQEGASMKQDVGGLATGAMKKTISTAKVGIKAGAYALTGGIMGSVAGIGAKKLGANISAKIKDKRAEKMVEKGQAQNKEEALKKMAENKQRKKEMRATKLKNAGQKFNRFMGSSAGQMLTSYLGLSEDAVDLSDEIEVENQDGTKTVLKGDEAREERGKRRVKGMLERRADISNMTFKAFGQITGLDKAQASLKKNGLIDEGKEVIQDALGGLGIKVDTSNSKSKLLTDKQKSDIKKKKDEKLRQDADEEAYQSKKAVATVFELIKGVKELPQPKKPAIKPQPKQEKPKRASVDYIDGYSSEASYSHTHSKSFKYKPEMRSKLSDEIKTKIDLSKGDGNSMAEQVIEEMERIYTYTPLDKRVADPNKSYKRLMNTAIQNLKNAGKL